MKKRFPSGIIPNFPTTVDQTETPDHTPDITKPTIVPETSPLPTSTMKTIKPSTKPTLPPPETTTMSSTTVVPSGLNLEHLFDLQISFHGYIPHCNKTL